MTNFDKLLLAIARISRFLNLPHFVKYSLFLLTKKRQILTTAKVNISNIEINVNLGDFIEYWIFIDGLYETDWVNKVKDLVRGKVLIDIGAHIGIYPLSLFKDAKYIYAFEPEKENYAKLVQNLKTAEIKNVIAIKKAVSSRNRKNAKLFISREDTGWHSLSIPHSGGTQKVNTITLDYFIRKNRIQSIGLIKIDVEGTELEVLKGLTKTLKKSRPPLLIELNRPRLELSGYSINDIYWFLRKHNYQAYLLKKNKFIRLKKAAVLSIYNQNALFMPEERAGLSYLSSF